MCRRSTVKYPKGQNRTGGAQLRHNPKRTSHVERSLWRHGDVVLASRREEYSRSDKKRDGGKIIALHSMNTDENESLLYITFEGTYIVHDSRATYEIGKGGVDNKMETWSTSADLASDPRTR